jgi:hypothetical protein
MVSPPSLPLILSLTGLGDTSDDPQITDHCNDFDLMVGLIFYNAEEVEDNTFALVDLMIKFSNSSFGLDNAAYDALYLTSQYNDTATPTSLHKRAQAFDFCASKSYGLNCSLVLFNFYDNYSYTVSEAYYQLEDGACNDSFTLSSQNWYAYGREESRSQHTASLISSLVSLGGNWKLHHQ